MIEVLKPGMYTSVQDLGRFGYRSQGIPISGVMDREASALANALVGNTPDKAVLECTMLGPTLRFVTSASIAIAGGTFTTYLNNALLANDTVVSAQPNDVLSIGKAEYGMRCYVAVAGGIATSETLGSRSYYAGITPSAVVKKGDILPISSTKGTIANKNISEEKNGVQNQEIEVFKGPEFKLLSEQKQVSLLQTDLVISPQSNRMAYLLEHSQGLSASEIVTAPVQPGTVQLTPSGKLIVLMRDAQVTGGYARILQLSEGSINSLAQRRGGEVVRFKSYTIH